MQATGLPDGSDYTHREPLHDVHHACISVCPQMQIRQKEAQQVAPYSASFQRSMIGSILDSPDGGVSLVRRS